MIKTSLPLLQKERYNFDDLVELLAILRSPDGCPWDREQTHSSIRNDCIEEAYEVIDAIDANNPEMLKEETGDILLQAAFHARIAEEAGGFDAGDMITGLCKKLIYRHRHVFGDMTAASGADALRTWEAQKDAKKNFATVAEDMQSIPKSFPQTLRAQKAQKKARKANFDFADISDAFAKFREEIAEFEAALSGGSPAEKEIEAGDCLFALINVLRLVGIDPEIALNRATDKFIRRFTLLEKVITEKGLNMKEMTAEEIDAFYRNIKCN